MSFFPVKLEFEVSRQSWKLKVADIRFNDQTWGIRRVFLNFPPTFWRSKFARTLTRSIYRLQVKSLQMSGKWKCACFLKFYQTNGFLSKLILSLQPFNVSERELFAIGFPFSYLHRFFRHVCHVRPTLIIKNSKCRPRPRNLKAHSFFFLKVETKGKLSERFRQNSSIKSLTIYPLWTTCLQISEMCKKTIGLSLWSSWRHLLKGNYVSFYKAFFIDWLQEKKSFEFLDARWKKDKFEWNPTCKR